MKLGFALSPLNLGCCLHASRIVSVESLCLVSVVVAACLQSFSWCVRCRVPCAVTVSVFDPVRFRFHSSLFDSLLRVFELMGVAVLAFARRTSPSRPCFVLVSDLEFSHSWGLGVL